MKKSRLLGAVCACLIFTQSESATVTYDADDFTIFDIANNLLPSATLSVVGTDLLLTGDSVITVKPGQPVQGTTDFVFGFSQTNHGTIGGGYQTVHNELRIDFELPTDSVSVLFATGNGLSAFTGVVRAFDSAGTLLEEAFSDPLTPSLETSWASLTRLNNDMAYIQAAGWGGTIASIDVIEFNAVPIPPAIWLFGSGLLGLIGIARKKSA